MRYSDDNKSVEDRFREAELELWPYFPHTSYLAFKTHVLPIMEQELTSERRTAYQDPLLPGHIAAQIEKVDWWGRFWVGSFTVIVPWLVARSPANFIRNRVFWPEGINFFDRWVLVCTLGLYFPLYPVTHFIGERLPLVQPDRALAIDLKNSQLSKYRKRYAEARPDLISEKYKESPLFTYDGTKLHIDLQPPSNSQGQSN